jgi:H+/gluconate symporter-like permease
MKILEKFSLIPSKVKDYILIGLIVSIVIIVIVMSINNFNDVRRQIKIEKTKNELVDTKIQVEQDKKALEDNVKAHDSFIQTTVKEIKNITKIKPKRIKYEKIKVRDTSYDAMRRVLDTAQPN